MFAERHRAVALVLDDAGRGLVEANETQPAQHSLRPVAFGQELLVAQAVLKREQHRVRPQQRREQSRQRVVGRGLDRDQHEIAGADGSVEA